jgi:hypothetical protein
VSTAPITKSPLRFAVGENLGPRSGVWRVWSQGDQTYVAPRGGKSKASLHDGPVLYHGDHPHFRWSRPAEFGPGATDLYRVWFPTEELTSPSDEPPDAEKRKIQLIDPAPQRAMVVVSVVRTISSVELKPPTDVPTGLLARWTLRGGDEIWVIAAHVPYLEQNRAMVAQAKTAFARHLGDGNAEALRNAGHLRVVFFLRELDGRIGIVEASPAGISGL